MKKEKSNTPNSLNNERFITKSKHKQNITYQKNQSESERLHALWNGVSPEAILKAEYSFVTDKEEKASELVAALRSLKYDELEIEKWEDEYFINGYLKTSMRNDVVANLTEKLCKIGYEYDCDFVGFYPDLPDDPIVKIPRGLKFKDVIERAKKHVYKDQLVDADAYYSRAIEMKSDDAITHFNRGCVRSMMGKKIDAILDYNRAIELNPKYEKAYRYRGIEKGEMGDYREAKSDLKKAIKLNPSNPLSYLGRAMIYMQICDMDKAYDTLIKALDYIYISEHAEIDVYELEKV